MNDEFEMKLQGFEDWCWSNLAPKTTENTLRSLRHLMREGVNIDDRRTFKDWVQKERKKGTLDRTLNTYIKAYNRYLMFRGEVKIKLFREQKSLRPERADMDQYRRLKNACRGYTKERMELVIDLLFKTGIRMNELHRLTVDDVKDDTITILGKGQKTRVVWIPESVRDALRRYLRVRRAEQGIEALFTNMHGKPLTYNGLRMDIYQLSRRAGVHFSPHMARRFYARFLYQQGYDLEQIRLTLGHTNLDTTKRYMQVDQKDVLDAFRSKKPDFFLAEVKLL